MRIIYILIIIVSMGIPAFPEEKIDQGIASPNRETLTSQSIENQIIPAPKTAIMLTDSAEKLQLIPEYKAHIIRSKAYTRLKNEKKALEHALAAFHTDSVQNDSIAYMNVCHLLGTCYIELSRQNEAIDYATKAIQTARSLGNKLVEASAMITISRAQNELMLKDEVLETLDQAIALVQGSSDPQERIALAKLYFEKVQDLMIFGKEEEAIETGKKEEKLLEEMRQTSDIPEMKIDMYSGYLYSILCEAYQLIGDKRTAALYYDKFLSTHFAQKPQGKTRADRYLLLIKDYKQVIHNTLERERLTPAQDSITKDYTVMLRKLKNAYSLMGDYKTALHYGERLISIQQELYARDKENAAMELAIAYDTNEKEIKILKQASELKERNLYLAASCGAITLLLLLLWITIRNNRIIKRKNKITVSQVNQLLICKDELQITKEQNIEMRQELQALSPQQDLSEAVNESLSSSDEPNDQDHFIRLEKLMRKEKLFLNPNLTRDDILRLLQIDKNRFSRMMQSNTGDNYTTYLCNLRVEYAIQLMKKHPHYTLQAIATDSGIGNVRTLHRIFRSKTGMTPTEYKKALQ